MIKIIRHAIPVAIRVHFDGADVALVAASRPGEHRKIVRPQKAALIDPGCIEVFALVDRWAAGQKRDRFRRAAIILQAGRIEQWIGAALIVRPVQQAIRAIRTVRVITDHVVAEGRDGIKSAERLGAQEDVSAGFASLENGISYLEERAAILAGVVNRPATAG